MHCHPHIRELQSRNYVWTEILEFDRYTMPETTLFLTYAVFSRPYYGPASKVNLMNFFIPDLCTISFKQPSLLPAKSLHLGDSSPTLCCFSSPTLCRNLSPSRPSVLSAQCRSWRRNGRTRRSMGLTSSKIAEVLDYRTTLQGHYGFEVCSLEFEAFTYLLPPKLP